MRCPRTLHGILHFAAQESADYLCGSSAAKCKLLVTYIVRVVVEYSPKVVSGVNSTDTKVCSWHM